MTRQQFLVALFAPIGAFLTVIFAKPDPFSKYWSIRKIYIDPKGSGLVGYKGKTALDAGFFYCPYVPLYSITYVNERN